MLRLMLITKYNAGWLRAAGRKIRPATPEDIAASPEEHYLELLDERNAAVGIHGPSHTPDFYVEDGDLTAAEAEIDAGIDAEAERSRA